MLKAMIRVFFSSIGAVLGYTFVPILTKQVFNLQANVFTSHWFGTLLGIVVAVLLTWPVIPYTISLIRSIESTLRKTPTVELLGGTIGAVVGLIISYLVSPTLRAIPIIGLPLSLFVCAACVFFGLQLGHKREDIVKLFFSRLPSTTRNSEVSIDAIKYEKFLDTSVIIDGRILDLVQTGFVDGTLVVPTFVLEELQHIADSSDELKRKRGRRGLDILNEMQKRSLMPVKILEIDYADVSEVDSKLVRLAKERQGKVVTNDFNLNKVCEVHGVDVLNVNDLANAIKSVVIPGEAMRVDIQKPGKEANQGIAYLDDGTMIVVDGGYDKIGQTVKVIVTSALQTSAGRMIFAKVDQLEKAL